MDHHLLRLLGVQLTMNLSRAIHYLLRIGLRLIVSLNLIRGTLGESRMDLNLPKLRISRMLDSSMMLSSKE